MSYRHLTPDELDVLCAKYPVLSNLRDAGIQANAVARAGNGLDPSDADAYFFHSKYFAEYAAHVAATDNLSDYSVFWKAQRDYHNTARILAGLKPYR